MHPIFIDYLTAIEIDCSVNTKANYKVAYKHFTEYLESKEIPFESITQPQVQQYVVDAAQTLKTSTIKARVKAVRAAFNHAKNVVCTIDRNDDPFWKLRYPQEPACPPETFTDEEVQKLFKAITDDREWLCFHLFAYAGLRREEVCDLKWENISFTSRQLEIVGKGNKWRRVPLHPTLAKALAPHRASGYVIVTKSHSGWQGQDKPAGTRVDPDTLHRSLAFWFKRAGVEGTMHMFRRTVASVLLEKGVQKEYRDEILGWAPQDVAGRHYTRMASPQLHEAICKLNYGGKTNEGTTRRTHRRADAPRLHLVSASA